MDTVSPDFFVMDSRLIMPPSLLLLLSEPSCVDVTDMSSVRLQKCSPESKLVWLLLTSSTTRKYKQNHCATRNIHGSCRAWVACRAADAVLVCKVDSFGRACLLPLADPLVKLDTLLRGDSMQPNLAWLLQFLAAHGQALRLIMAS